MARCATVRMSSVVRDILPLSAEKAGFQQSKNVPFSALILDPDDIKKGKDDKGNQTNLGVKTGDVGIYGHEQVHVDLVIKRYKQHKKDIENKLETTSLWANRNKCYYKSKEDCEKALAGFVTIAINIMKTYIYSLVKPAFGHNDKDNTAPDKPKEHEQLPAQGDGESKGDWHGHGGVRIGDEVR